MRSPKKQHADGQHDALTCAASCSLAPSRRRALAAGGALVATGTLAACGAGQTPAQEAPADDNADDNDGDNESGADSGDGAQIRLPLEDTPVGGSTFYEAEELIVSQPTEGEIVVFDATCTHQGCMVSDTGDEATLVCPCHNSVFSSESGEVLSGPATGPLATLDAEVDGAEIVISA